MFVAVQSSVVRVQLMYLLMRAQPGYFRSSLLVIKLVSTFLCCL